MIKTHVDVVLAVRDGFSGLPPAPSALSCVLDGRTYRPVSKQGGYLVFPDIGSGEHEIVLRGAHFRDERIKVTCSGCDCTELVATMKPAENYPFGRSVTWLTLLLRSGKAPTPGGRVWMAPASPMFELKTAQEKVEAGDTECRLFFKAQAAGLSLPGHFLLSDGADTEICRLDSLSGETGFFAPFAKPHKRGRSLVPAQVWAADGEGRIRAVFREPVEVAVYSPESGGLGALSLVPGENSAEFAL